MKTRNRLYDKSRLRLLCLLTALLGLFGAGHALAGNPTTLTVGGTDVLNGGYWTTNADGTLTPDGASADNYNVYYDGNGTLTLKDATINGTDIIGHVGAGIYAEGDLTIVLEGTSTVTGVQDPNGESQSIRVSGNLTIQGDGSLTAQGAGTSSGSSYGVFVIGSFTQQSGSVTAIGGDVSGNYTSTGLYVYGGTVTAQDGTLTATGGDTSGSSYGISMSSSSSVTVGSATVTVTGGTGNYSYGLYVNPSSPSVSPSVTLSGSGSLTARSGSGTDTAVGIYLVNIWSSTGSVTVGNGSTLLTNSVIFRDSSFNENPLAPTGDGSWLIYGQSGQTSAVGGNYTLEENLTIESGNTLTIPAGSTLTVPQGKTLTVNGTLTNQGTLSIAAESCLTGSGSLEGDGSFTAVAVTGIEVPDDVTCADYEKKVVLAGPTVLGHAFTADGWTLTFTKGEVTLDGCTYTVTASKEGSESIEKTFTAQHSFGEDGKCPCGASRPTQDAEGCYQVADAFQLFWFAGLVNGTLTDGTEQNTSASAVLTADIELSGETWTPIGSESTPYTGTFDGQNHTISGMTLENAESYSGLFGNVTGTVRDFTVTGSITITGSEAVSKVGGAVGSLGIAKAGGTVSGVTSDVDITVSAGNDHIGGVVGSMPENSSPTVESCVYTGNITVTVAAGSVAGVVGYIRTGTIQNCANQGGINTGGNGSVGGILGYCNNGKIYIRNCYNSGSIAAEGIANVGAIVGQNNKTQATVSNCYYLTGSADKGQGQLDTDAVGTVVKDDNAFTSGEVACLLQGDQTVQVWGQTLGTDDYPVLTTDEAMHVYAAKLYKGSAENVSELYKNASGISSPEEPNALLVIENAPSASTGTNIVVKSGDAYTCVNLVLTDGADFYTPVAFTATQATYSRLLAEGTQWGTVALPFDATSVTGAELFRVARQEGNALYVDETNGMAGGEPLVFRANAGVTKVDFMGTEVTVRATTDAATGSTLLKGTSQTVSPLDEGSYFIYGDKFYRVAQGSQVGMKPFRAYIPAAAGASTRSAGAASQLRIIFNADK
ncbi:hypothetical protein H6A30_12120 [Bacteroides caecigallinarum]|uniref:beta strand repeat-containing protein n=1 Tax=Bacteroides caecigallinarum TaxID=1411144 RepID=UPI0019579509|nr:hypothetical protein [Bacteroides caecigallinarum]MBM6890982.1 hypothetical protein [Bacteroides caecigallinarum]